MVVIRAGLGDHVDGSSFGAAVCRRGALRANYEFLDSFQRKLHNGATDGVVLVVHAVDGGVDVATTLSIYGENGVAILSGIIGVCRLYARSKVCQVSDVAAKQRQFFYLARSNLLAHTGFDPSTEPRWLPRSFRRPSRD